MACSSRRLGPSSVSCLFSLVVFTQFGVTTHTQDLEACSSRRLGPSSVSCFCPTWIFDKKRWLQAPCALTPDTDLAQGLVNKVSAGGAPLGSQSSIVTFELGGKHAAFIHSPPVRWQISSSTTSEVQTRWSTVAGDLCSTWSSSRSFWAQLAHPWLGGMQLSQDWS